MNEPRVEKILELEEKIGELNKEFTARLKELGQWFRSQHFTILEMELLDCDDDWDVLGVLEDEEEEETGGEGTDYDEKEYFQLLEKFEAILEKKRQEKGR